MSTVGAVPTQPDMAKVEAFVGRMLGDMGAAFSAALVLLGDRLGLYKTLAAIGPTDTEGLAAATQTDERYIREWLAAQAASGYVSYDPSTGRYWLEPEQAMVFADEESPVYLTGFYDIAASAFRDEPKITEAFRTGKGVGWHEHDSCLFRGTERFFRTSYRHHLVSEWLPALDGVVQKLEQGAHVADVGCGHGASTLLMAEAFPNSTFIGFDYHDASIERARGLAEEAKMADRVSFQKATAKDFPGEGYDLICVFDCLHDMGDPVGAAVYIHSKLKSDGTWMIVEPFAHDSLAENLNPVGRLYYAASTMICTPASKAQEVGLALGAQAGEARLSEVVRAGGFSQVRRAAETPFNIVLEAKP